MRRGAPGGGNRRQTDDTEVLIASVLSSPPPGGRGADDAEQSVAATSKVRGPRAPISMAGRPAEVQTAEGSRRGGAGSGWRPGWIRDVCRRRASFFERDAEPKVIENPLEPSF